MGVRVRTESRQVRLNGCFIFRWTRAIKRFQMNLISKLERSMRGFCREMEHFASCVGCFYRYTSYPNILNTLKNYDFVRYGEVYP